MKTRVSKPARHKARYAEEYKQEALELWRASGRSAAKVAAELGIRAPLLYRWASLEREPNVSKSERGPGRSVEELEAEIRRLRAENAKLLEQREVLKNRWASSPKRRPEVCPNRTDERSTQSSLVMRGTLGLAQRLLRLEEAAHQTRTATTGEHSSTRMYSGRVCSQSSDLRQPTIGSCLGLPMKAQPHRPAHARGAALRSTALQVSSCHH
jgi:transposase